MKNRSRQIGQIAQAPAGGSFSRLTETLLRQPGQLMETLAGVSAIWAGRVNLAPSGDGGADCFTGDPGKVGLSREKKRSKKNDIG
jgi:hypothetical protein